MNPQKQHPATLGEMFASLWRNRQLIGRMAKRDVVGRYRGSVMGLAWSFFNPMLMLAVYTFVFSVVFKMRWGQDDAQNKTDFAIVLFAGMIVFGLFAECLNQAPRLILTNANYVKKVVFPLEILPWVTMGSALFHTLVNLAVLLMAQLVIKLYLPWTAIVFPLLLIPLLLLTMGAIWFFAAMGVYLRDIGQTVGIFVVVLQFLSPVFYPASALPVSMQSWQKLNPLSFIIESGRDVLVFGRLPNMLAWLICSFCSLLLAWMGFWWFQRSRKGFADVL